jgi:hypothetical protein
MTFKQKSQVLLAFSFRIPLIAISSLHLVYFKPFPTSQEPQFAVTNVVLLQQAMVIWSLISATIPNMKNFMKSFSMHFSFPLGWGSTARGFDGYPLQSLTGLSGERHQAFAQWGSQPKDDNRSERSACPLVMQPHLIDSSSMNARPSQSREDHRQLESVIESNSQELATTRQTQQYVSHEHVADT